MSTFRTSTNLFFSNRKRLATECARVITQSVSKYILVVRRRCRVGRGGHLLHHCTGSVPPGTGQKRVGQGPTVHGYDTLRMQRDCRLETPIFHILCDARCHRLFLFFFELPIRKSVWHGLLLSSPIRQPAALRRPHWRT